MPRLTTIAVSDPPEPWAALGFAVAGGCCAVGEVTLRFDGGAGGISGWAFDGPAPHVDGIAEVAPALDPPPTAEGHPNGVIAVDHVVLAVPDLPSAVDALVAGGLELRRVREVGGGRQQAFFWVGQPILEVVGAAAGTAGPSRLWGITFTVADLDATAGVVGDRLRPPKPAVQPGRRIATVDRAAGLSVPVAFMTPHVQR